MAAPECLPLKTVEDVLAWEAGQDSLSVATTVLAKRKPAAHNVPRTLICHDMRGGYLQDRFVQGCSDDLVYRFYHWQYIDTFVYFSHYFVTKPPPCWTNAAHKHGVQMLGTLITEWDDGKVRCLKVIESEDSYKAFADKLVHITRYYGFDGWLVNIENPVQEDKVQNLCDFVSYLSQKMHQSLPGSKVIWYDSVINTGKLKWQDALNESNSMFFDVCDGIFLNYNWNDEKLIGSKTMASAKNRTMDVYVGIDVFGRGCLGGGGYNTIEALTAIRRQNMSAAIFAQGWVYEKHDQKSFTHNENRFWRLLQHLLPMQELSSSHIPLSTSFCQGFGQKYFLHGKPVSECTWHNMSLQELQPMYTDAQFEGGKSQCCPHLSLCTERAYNGGNCLQLQATFNMGTEPVMFRLFSLDVTVKEPCLLSYTYYLPPGSECDLFLETEVELHDSKLKFTFRGDNPQSEETNSKYRVISPCSEEELQVMKEFTTGTKSDDDSHWRTRYFMTPVTDGSSELRILSIDVGLYTLLPGQPKEHTVYLGQVQLIPKSFIKKAPEVAKITTSGNLVSWECSDPSSVKYYNLYTKQPQSVTLIGQAQHCLYSLPSGETNQHTDKPEETEASVGTDNIPAKKEKIMKDLTIQPILKTGFFCPVESCSSAKVLV